MGGGEGGQSNNVAWPLVRAAPRGRDETESDGKGLGWGSVYGRVLTHLCYTPECTRAGVCKEECVCTQMLATWIE